MGVCLNRIGVVYSPPEVLQIHGRLCHLVLAFLMVGDATSSRAPLLHGHYSASFRYYGPDRHPLAFDRLPGCAGYTIYPTPAISRRGEEGFSSCSACPCHRAVASHPAEVKEPLQSDFFGSPCCTSPSRCGLGLRGYALSRPHSRLLSLRPGGSSVSPRETLSIGFRVLVSRHPAIQTTGLLTFAPAGLSPAEHARAGFTGHRAGHADLPHPVLHRGETRSRWRRGRHP